MAALIYLLLTFVRDGLPQAKIKDWMRDFLIKRKISLEISLSILDLVPHARHLSLGLVGGLLTVERKRTVEQGLQVLLFLSSR